MVCELVLLLPLQKKKAIDFTTCYSFSGEHGTPMQANTNGQSPWPCTGASGPAYEVSVSLELGGPMLQENVSAMETIPRIHMASGYSRTWVPRPRFHSPTLVTGPPTTRHCWPSYHWTCLQDSPPSTRECACSFHLQKLTTRHVSNTARIISTISQESDTSQRANQPWRIHNHIDMTIAVCPNGCRGHQVGEMEC